MAEKHSEEFLEKREAFKTRIFNGLYEAARFFKDKDMIDMEVKYKRSVQNFDNFATLRQKEIKRKLDNFHRRVDKLLDEATEGNEDARELLYIITRFSGLIKILTEDFPGEE